jgi:PAS domain S-box-containing protein
MEAKDAIHIHKLIQQHSKRLRYLEQQEAFYGISCPPHIKAEIDDLKKIIKRLRRREKTVVDKPNQLAKSASELIKCPYPGMAPFLAEDSHVFYGRETEIQGILQHLRHNRYLFVIGPSGSGKSSLISAGLLPRLQKSSYFSDRPWIVCEMRPGAQPMRILVEAIQNVSKQLGYSLDALLAGHTPQERLLLIIDQFEELFTQADREEQSRFIATLKTLREKKKCSLLIAMRADFYPDLMISDLWPVPPPQRLEVTPLRGEALRQAIQQPAKDVGVHLEAGLLERLMADAAEEPGVLPLIQETMVLLWGRMSNNMLPLSAYEDLAGEGRSGLAIAVTTKADAILDDLTPSQRFIARKILLRLIHFGEGRADTRRQQTVAKLCSGEDDLILFDQTLHHLANNRLITLSGEENSDRRKVDLAHEALITGWPTLYQWLIDRREAEQIRRRLESHTIEWMRLGCGRGGLLDDVELREAERWLESQDAKDLGIDDALLNLVDASRSAINASKQEQLLHVALLASERRYREFIDAIPLLAWTAKPNGELDYFNQRWYGYTGQSENQTLGTGWQMALHRDDFQYYLDSWYQAVHTGQPYEIEYRWKRADGVYRWHLGRALPVRNEQGDIAYWVGTATDIEEQKQAEAQQRLLAEASVLLVSSLDYELMLTQLTRLMVPRLADWCAIHILEEGIIRRLAFTHSDPAKQALVDDRPERYPLNPNARHIVSHVLRSSEPEIYSAVPDALLIEAARDQEHLQTLRALAFRSYMCLPMVARGHTLGTITLATGESGRRYSQAELAFGEDLASRAAIALDNARLYHDAQAAVRARDQFLSIASHELKTPVTSLLGYVELLQRRAARSSDMTERDQRAIRVIGEQAARLNKLIGALLNLSRIETGQLSIERGLVDLNALARRLVEETQPTTDRHIITFSGADQPIMLLGDELRLEQVIQNLIQNAIKYSPNAGPIYIQVERREDLACIMVKDQGIGIPQAGMLHLFKRFYRGSNADERHISGMGIGLYVVKEIVELHGGTVEVTSKEGEGSCFTVCLPLLQQPKQLMMYKE